MVPALTPPSAPLPLLHTSDESDRTARLRYTAGQKFVLDKEQHKASGLFDTLQLLKAYEQAIDENIISSITDAQGLIVHANKRFCEVSQFPIEELLGQSHRIINSEFHSKTFFKNMWKVIGSGTVWHDDIRNRAKNGTFYWVDTVIVPVKDDAGRNTHYLSLRTLISERKDLEAKRQKYVSSLEVLLVMTANNIRKPLSDCLEIIRGLEHDKFSGNADLKQIVQTLQLSVSQLTGFSNELSSFIREIEH